MAGACGAVAGAATASIFLWMRLNQIFLAASADRTVRPEFPAATTWLLPLGWTLAVLTVAIALVPPEAER